MTLYDFIKLIRRKAKLMIGLPVACILVALLITLVVPASYSATASFVTNGDATLALGYANSAISAKTTSGVDLAASLNVSAKQVSVTAKGSDAGTCVTAVNDVVDVAAKDIEADKGKATVSAASAATNTSPAIVKRILVALFGGLVIALCVIAIGDAVRSPIRSRKDAESVSGLPVLGSISGDNGGEKLLANLQFQCDGIPSSVAVVSAGAAHAGSVISSELGKALEHAGIRVKIVRGVARARKFKVRIPENAAVIVDCAPLAEGVGAAYIAHDADITLLCVTEWETTKPQLVSTLEELKLAKADIAGIAYMVSETPKRESRGRRMRNRE